MNRRLRIATWAGLALIVATNAVALAGAAFNRAGEPQATLKLGERELSPPFAGYGKKENSGLSLRLRWQVLQSPASTPHGKQVYYGGSNPGWLDGPKMRELGFDTRPPATRTYTDHAPRHEQPPRDVFFALEFNGPAYRESLRRAGAAVQDASAADSQHQDAEQARIDLDEAQRLDTRLFVVDASLDAAALRTRYPDRTMVAIVRGRVSPLRGRVDDDPGGTIDGLSVDEINVPLDMRAVFDGVEPATRYDRRQPAVRFDATVVFGQRFEPWLASAARR